MKKKDKIYIAGHSGLVGSALVRRLKSDGFKNIITATPQELDLTDQQAVNRFFKQKRPDYVFLLAANVGGIRINYLQPVDFIYPNLLIECNVINSAWEVKVKKLLFLACACVYPKDCRQPMKEEYLLSGYLEPTNISHAVAKISGIILCQSFNRQYRTNFISCVSSNIFGPHDNFDLLSGHVVASLINKFHSAKLNNHKKVILWGTGKPRRDFIFVDDVADACLFIMNKKFSEGHINLSLKSDISIKELAESIKEVVGYKGQIEFDTTKSDGMLKKSLDNTRLSRLGWMPRFSIKKGLKVTYQWYLSHKDASNHNRSIPIRPQRT